MECDVCDGTPGLYPIFNKRGQELYSIPCPECSGAGLSPAARDLIRPQAHDARRYADAMVVRPTTDGSGEGQG